MTLDKQNGRAPTPDRSTQPLDALSLQQVDLTISSIPAEGRPRLLWLAAVELAISRDARRTREQMLFDGWDEPDAYAAYRDWLCRLVDQAAAEGWWAP